jgi:hypothetical protein
MVLEPNATPCHTVPKVQHNQRYCARRCFIVPYRASICPSGKPIVTVWVTERQLMIISRGNLTPGRVAELVRLGERKKHADGAGLYLVVRAPGRGYWIRQLRKSGVLSAAGKPAFGSPGRLSGDVVERRAGRARQVRSRQT